MVAVGLQHSIQECVWINIPKEIKCQKINEKRKRGGKTKKKKKTRRKVSKTLLNEIKGHNMDTM